MAAKGWGGALLCDAGGAEQDGNAKVPHGPTFFTPEWRELYRHALGEADRLGLELSLSIQSGWNLGGPTVVPEDAPKKLVWSEARVTGPARIDRRLEEPDHPKEFYRDVAVVAYPARRAKEDASRRPLQSWAEKALHKALHFSAPDTSVLLEELPAEPGEEDAAFGGRARPDGPVGPGRYSRLGRAGGRVGGAALRLHPERPLAGLHLQRRRGRLRARSLRRERLPLVLAGRGRAAHRRCRPAGGARAQVPAHRQLGGRSRELDAHLARGIPAAPRLRPAAVPARAWRAGSWTAARSATGS